MTTSIDQSTKTQENRLRRMAQRQGLLLVKSRRRDPDAPDYGLYVLAKDTAGNHIGRYGGQEAVSEFANGGGLTLQEVEATLTRGAGH